jgi:hypothetical protein
MVSRAQQVALFTRSAQRLKANIPSLFYSHNFLTTYTHTQRPGLPLFLSISINFLALESVGQGTKKLVKAGLEANGIKVR